MVSIKTLLHVSNTQRAEHIYTLALMVFVLGIQCKKVNSVQCMGA